VTNTITGAGGFIGSHLVELLAASGALLRTLDEYQSYGRPSWLSSLNRSPNVEVFTGDVRDYGQMRSLVKGSESVLHLASLIAIPYSYSAPHSYAQTNIIGTLNLLEAAREAGVRRFIHTSTSEVYGTAMYVPIDEDHPIQAQSPYSASKIGADALVRSFVDSFDFPAVTLRPFNTFGPRQSQRAVIPTLAAQFLSRAPRIRVGSLKPTRDFTYVTDTARAFAMSLDAQGIEGEVINLGTGWEVSIEGIIELLTDLTGHKPLIEVDENRIRPVESEVQRLLSDNSKAKRLLDWEPEFAGEAGFKRGLGLTLEWLDDELSRGHIKPEEYVR
jgi:NAD dependent epimerase/dehydratase